MFSASKTAGPSGYNINNSLRFRQSASPSLTRTPSSSGSQTTFTHSIWLKRGLLSSSNYVTIYGSESSGANYVNCAFLSDTLYWTTYNGSTNITIQTTQVFRDVSAWYHLVIAVDTTQATASNRVKLYINGLQITAGTFNYPTLNQALQINTASFTHKIGFSLGFGQYFDGYMAEVNFIDGQALTPSSFGSTNATTGVWQPAKYTGSYGTNGFYLPFSDIGLTSGSNTGLGKDFSGNSNYLTTNNISVTSGTTYDAMTDSPTNTSATVANYATLNPNLRQTGTGQAPTSGNLKLTANTTGYSQVCCATIASTSGKFYWEVTVNGGYGGFGIADSNNSAFTSVVCTTSSVTANPGQYTWGWTIEISNGNKQNNNVSTSYGSAASSGDVYMCAVDIDNGKIWWGKNGTWFASGSPAAGTNAAFTNVSGNIIPYFSPTDAGGWTQDVNFGQRPFSYTPPTGFNRLNTFNLPTSTIVKGNSYFDSTTWTGNGNTSRTITNAASFRPDFVWLKERDIAIDHILYDSIRGPSTSSASKALCSNTTVAEGSQNDNSTYGYLDGFTSSGFTVTRGSDGATSYTNKNNGTYVGWQWQAGQGTNTTNTVGSITSTVSVNTTAGFSIVTYTGNATANATVGHGLGVTPRFFVVKVRSTTGEWLAYHVSTGKDGFMQLQSTAAFASSANYWGTTGPTSTTFQINGGGGVNNNGSTYVAYCWAEIAGFSAFGSYTGNGSADGPFVFTGFRPKFVLTKRTNGAGDDWTLFDTARNTYNLSTAILRPNTSQAELSSSMDLLSNGFKWRQGGGNGNESGGTYIFMAFAENPFKNALAR